MMIIVRRLTVFFIAVFLVGFYFGPKVTANFFNPGSEDDPLVSKKWVDKYIGEEFSPFHERVQILASRTRTMELSAEQIKMQLRPTIILTIGSKTGLINKEPYVLDAPPFLMSGRTLLPLRFIGEAFGINFTWDKETKTVTYPSPKGQVTLTMGKKTARVGEDIITMDMAGKIVSGRTFVPLRFIGESLGAQVIWHGAEKKAEIR